MNPFIATTTTQTNALISICFIITTRLLLTAPVAAVSNGFDVLDTGAAQYREHRRVPENILKLKESTTTADSYDDTDAADDVFAIPIDDFRDYWYGRRLRKRSLLSIDDNGDDTLIGVPKRTVYQAWGSKRARYPYDIFHMPKGFNPMGGKRAGVAPGAKGFNPMGGKRAGVAPGAKGFNPMGGKRAAPGARRGSVDGSRKRTAYHMHKGFNPMGGKKRADSFRTWGEERAPVAEN